MSRLKVSAVPVLSDNYVWLITNPDTGETAAVDPSVTEPVLEAVATEGLRLTQILNTHWHPDHTGGNQGIKAATGAPITAPAEAQKVSSVDRIVSEGDRVTVTGAEAIVWDIPAHTAGHVAYYFEDEGMIFVGDTMFAMGCGRLFECTPAQMWSSLQKIVRWPDRTRLYCAHEYTQANGRFALTVEPGNRALVARMQEVARARAAGLPTIPTTLALEKATNPFLRAASRDLQATVGLSGASEVEVFAKTRALKDAF